MNSNRKIAFGAVAVFAAVMLYVFAPPAAFAQMGMGNGQRMRMKMPRYDTATVVTVSGTVEKVEETTMMGGQMGEMRGMGGMGLHLVLKTTDKTFTVLVGPASFANDKGFKFAKGDQIEVTGSQVKYEGADALIAREIKKGDKTLTLRNKDGVPEWSMGRQR